MTCPRLNSPQLPLIIVLITFLSLLKPAFALSQQSGIPPDSLMVETQIRHYTVLHGIGTGLCVVGGVTTAVGLIMFIPAITSSNALDTHSNTPYRTTTLAVVAGGLTIGIIGIVTLSRANARLTVLRKQQKELSVGYEVSQGYPGISARYRF